MKKIVGTLFLLLFFSEGFSQGKIDGFYRGSGNASSVLGLGFEDTPNYFIGTERSDIGRSLFFGSAFVAYGITPDFDINASLPFFVSNDKPRVQDLTLFLKYRLFQTEFENSKLEISSALGFSTPVSDYETGGLNDIGQKATILETRGVVHYQWNTGWFLTLQSGYSFKFDEVPNSFPLTFKSGRALSNWYYDFWYDYQKSFGGIDYRGTPRPQNFKEIGVDYHKTGGTVYRPLGQDFGVYASFSYTISGRNVFQGAGYGIGLVYNFSLK
ncbi:MAG: transporter [Flavobacteriaceae bacterium]